MKRVLFFIVSAVVAIIPLNLSAQGSYVKKVFSSKRGVELLYRELVPSDEVCVEEQEKFPLVVFLHGAGERGADNELQLKHGSNMFLNPYNRAHYPAYVIFPQCPEGKHWAFDEKPKSYTYDMMPLLSDDISLQLLAVKDLIDSYIDKGVVDVNRIYVVGLSMGAMATYDIVTRYPDTFAAAVPICGTVNPKNILESDGIEKVAFRIFHGDSDTVVPVEGSRIAYSALKSLGSEPRYREFVGTNHDSWTQAFNQDDFMSWLFDQSRKNQ